MSAPAPTSAEEVIQAFQMLDLRLDLLEDNREIVEKEEFTGERVLEARTALLIEVQSNFLPLLRQQLADLLDSFDFRAFPETPQPNFSDVLRNISSIEPNVVNIKTFIQSLSPWKLHRIVSRIDSTHGIMKKFRCDRLLEKTVDLMCTDMHDLVEAYIKVVASQSFTIDDRDRLNELTEACYYSIDLMIGWSNRSDHEILQQKWPGALEELDTALTALVEQLRVSPRPDNNIKMIDFLELGIPHLFLTDQSESDRPSDPIKPHLRHLFTAFIPIIKLARIFYRRVMKTPANRPAFTLHEVLNSYDLERLNCEVLSLARSIKLVLDLLKGLNRTDDPASSLQDLRTYASAPAEVLYCCMATIASSFVPSAPLVERNPSENNYRVLFYQLKSDFYTATEEFHKIINRMEPLNFYNYWYTFSPQRI
ncbi:hypothetical protein PGT21_012789 [Puccinia graminis f. sp. tritici]|uniref:Uncharacterized protein n=1 Tax=Puccinia graminis f. sp. tritici TaxID=56615 RepID=A0A5B0NRH0_PUCGR|nr:hypothetical protein PGTUg99_001458 [Puccinia graminis f. sp. tritici]KAA1090760.1 hypothetical protein PGT21_012789 [Puccinia graminis f. sp. tritici]